MTVREFIGSRARGGKTVSLLLALFAVSLGASSEALAIDCVADAGGIIDGFVNYPVPPRRSKSTAPAPSGTTPPPTR